MSRPHTILYQCPPEICLLKASYPPLMLSATRREFQGLRGTWEALGFSSFVLIVSPSSKWPPLVNKAYIRQGVNPVILG